MQLRPLIPVWVIQDQHSGMFLCADLSLSVKLGDAGRLYSLESARDTAITQFGYEYEISQFWEFE